MSIWIEGRLMGLVLVVLTLIFMVYFQRRTSEGKVYPIRRLPQMDAVNEAISKSVEMGRPVLVTYGYRDAVDPAIMVGLELVKYASKTISEMGGEVILGIGPTQTMPLAIDNYKDGCTEAGRPDLFNMDNVYYLTHEQRAFISGIWGLLESRKPGAYLGMGWYWVDAIHVGIGVRRAGIMGIGGTEKYDTGALFMVTMDSVAMGSELFACGAYMSGEPLALSGMAAEDLIKWIMIALLLIGGITVATGSQVIINLLKL
jgi:hypothetical protein